jgi:GT2 family glycosyltransferase
VTAASVVVPARDAAGFVDEQLAALAAQTIASSLEVVVVDNGSSDATTAHVERWRPQLAGLQLVRAAGRVGPGYARNVGITAAVSDKLLFCDADDRVDTGWAEHLVAALDELDAVGGRIADWDAPTGSSRGGIASTEGSGFGFGFLPAFATCNAAVRRAAWEAVGGFDEDLLTCEDIDFAWRIQLAGYRVGGCPDAVVRYRLPATPGGELRTWFRYGRNQPRLMARFGVAGLEREPARRVAAKWVGLVLDAPALVRSGPAGDRVRRRWCREAGRRAGRVLGSVDAHTLYL